VTDGAAFVSTARQVSCSFPRQISPMRPARCMRFAMRSRHVAPDGVIWQRFLEWLAGSGNARAAAYCPWAQTSAIVGAVPALLSGERTRWAMSGARPDNGASMRRMPTMTMRCLSVAFAFRDSLVALRMRAQVKR
jgi:hypothetical protein